MISSLYLSLLVFLQIFGSSNSFKRNSFSISISKSLAIPSSTSSTSATTTTTTTSSPIDDLVLLWNDKTSWEDTITLSSELFQLKSNVSNIVALCDRIDAIDNKNSREFVLLQSKRKSMLTNLLQKNRQEYILAASFLSNRIPRKDFPNLQEIPSSPSSSSTLSLSSSELIPDCSLANVTYSESPLDVLLLSIFRDIVRKETGYRSDVKGIKGLLEEGRHYMLSEEGSPANQHSFVRRTLAALLTPFLPPFYRIFMAGIVPSKERGDPAWLVRGTEWTIKQLPSFLQDQLKPGNQIGPWFYAPALTSVVTPPFLAFLVGPSRINRRKDGQLGGMVVEKCKFLQESGCKGLCLHQCKLPAQQFFSDIMGLPLTVSPNFETQECQWSWGEVPLEPNDDPSFPKGCLVGCPTRSEIKLSRQKDQDQSSSSSVSISVNNNLCDSYR